MTGWKTKHRNQKRTVSSFADIAKTWANVSNALASATPSRELSLFKLKNIKKIRNIFRNKNQKI